VQPQNGNCFFCLLQQRKVSIWWLWKGINF
jgi:hypothetical protein